MVLKGEQLMDNSGVTFQNSMRANIAKYTNVFFVMKRETITDVDPAFL